MALKVYAIIKEKLIGGLKNDIRNLVIFHASSCKSQNVHFDGLVLPKLYKVLDEKELCLMTLKSDPKES